MQYYASRASDAALRVMSSRNNLETLAEIQEGLISLRKSIAEGESDKDTQRAIVRLMQSVTFIHQLEAKGAR